MPDILNPKKIIDYSMNWKKKSDPILTLELEASKFKIQLTFVENLTSPQIQPQTINPPHDFLYKFFAPREHLNVLIRILEIDDPQNPIFFQILPLDVQNFVKWQLYPQYSFTIDQRGLVENQIYAFSYALGNAASGNNGNIANFGTFGVSSIGNLANRALRIETNFHQVTDDFPTSYWNYDDDGYHMEVPGALTDALYSLLSSIGKVNVFACFDQNDTYLEMRCKNADNVRVKLATQAVLEKYPGPHKMLEGQT